MTVIKNTLWNLHMKNSFKFRLAFIMKAIQLLLCNSDINMYSSQKFHLLIILSILYIKNNAGREFTDVSNG